MQLFKPIGILPIEVSEQMLELICFLAVTFIIDYLLKKRMEKDFNKVSILNTYASIIISGGLYLMFGISMISIKGLILFFCLLYAANSDIYTREVSDTIPLLIFLTALIGVKIADIPLMILSAVIITLPQLIISMIKPVSYGGADIKIMAGCSFLLGIESGLIAIILGLTIGVITTLIIRIFKKIKDKSFPIVPYLAFGSMFAYFI